MFIFKSSLVAILVHSTPAIHTWGHLVHTNGIKTWYTHLVYTPRKLTYTPGILRPIKTPGHFTPGIHTTYTHLANLQLVHTPGAFKPSIHLVHTPVNTAVYTTGTYLFTLFAHTWYTHTHTHTHTQTHQCVMQIKAYWPREMLVGSC